MKQKLQKQKGRLMSTLLPQKWLMSLLTLLLFCIGSGSAWADTYVINSSTTASHSVGESTFTFGEKSITIINNGGKTISSGNNKGASGLKFSQGVTYTLTFPENEIITKITFVGYANDATTSKVSKINGGDRTDQANAFPVKVSDGTQGTATYEVPFNKTFNNSASFELSGAQAVLSITVETAAKYVITYSPTTFNNCDWWYTLGDETTQIKETRGAPAGIKVTYHASDYYSAENMLNCWVNNNLAEGSDNKYFSYNDKNPVITTSLSENLNIVPEFMRATIYKAEVSGKVGGTAKVYKANDSEKTNISGNKNKHWEMSDGVVFEATPADGYEFIKWNEGETANPLSFAAHGQETYTRTAVFAEIQNTPDAGVTVGSLDRGFGYNADHPSAVAPNGSYFVSFRNTSTEGETWYNWLLCLKDGNNFDSSTSIVDVRADAYGWKDGINNDSHAIRPINSTYDWSNFKEFMNGADVTINISRIGEKITIIAAARKDGKTYYETFALETNGRADQTLYAYLGTEHAELTNLWEGNFNVYADLTNVADENRANGSAIGENTQITWRGMGASSDNTPIGEKVYKKLSTYTSYIQLTGPFKAGDVVLVDVASGSTQDNKTVGFALKSAEGNGVTTTLDENGSEVLSYTLKAEDIESDGSIKIFRKSTESRFFSVTVRGNRTGQYSILADYGEGGVAFTSQTKANAGDKVTFTANPVSSDYYFMHWEEDGTVVEGAGNPYIYTVESKNKTLKAVFHQYLHVTVQPKVAGTGAADVKRALSQTQMSDDVITPQYNIEAGSWYRFTATPVSGYKFVKWEYGNGKESTDNPLDVQMFQSNLGYGGDAGECYDVKFYAVFVRDIEIKGLNFKQMHADANAGDKDAVTCDTSHGFNMGTGMVYHATSISGTGTTTILDTDDYKFGVQNDTWMFRPDGLYLGASGARTIGLQNCTRGEYITIECTCYDKETIENPLTDLQNVKFVEKNGNVFGYEVLSNGNVGFTVHRYTFIQEIKISPRQVYADLCDNASVWINGGAIPVTTVTSDDRTYVHAENKPSGTDTENDRRRYVYFGGLTSETLYTIDFDVRLETKGDHNNKVTIMSTASVPKNVGDDYVSDNYMKLEQKDGKAYINGTEFAWAEGTWYHVKVEVNKSEGKAITTITEGDENGTVIVTNTKEGVGGYAQASGLYFLTSRYGGNGDFDNIRITSPQYALGSVLRPQIEVTSVNGNSRQVTITAGQSEMGLEVTTYYSLDGGKTWKSFSGASSVVTLNSSEPLTANIVAYSTVQDYTVVESEKEYLTVNYGEPWKLDAAFEITDMQILNDAPTITFKDGTTRRYYTPKIRVVAKTGVLPTGTNYKVTVTYQNYEYDSHDGGARETVTCGELSTTSGTSNGSHYTSNELFVPASGLYRITVEAEGYETGVVEHHFYRNKYKKTYYKDYTSYNNLPEGDERVTTPWYYNETTDRYRMDRKGADFKQIDPVEMPGWTIDGGTKDYAWQRTRQGFSCHMDRYMTGKSNAMEEWYDFRTTQTNLDNPVFLREGYGLIKNANIKWNYRAAQANIGECNEIGMLRHQDANHSVTTMYAVPGYYTDRLVPEVYFDVDPYHAVMDYQVFTPVDTKDVGNTGLATSASYYPLYAVGDVYIDNDEYIDVYRTTGRNVYTKMYYLDQCWYVKQREGVLYASTAFRNDKIWNVAKINEAKEIFKANGGKTVEMRIIPEFYFYADNPAPRKMWKGTNEIVGVLASPENQYDSSWRLTIKGSEDGTDTGHPLLILNNGVTYDVPNVVNFYSLPSSSTTARMKHQSAYLRMGTTTYEIFKKMHVDKSNPANAPLRIVFGDCDVDEDMFDDATSIDTVVEETTVEDDAYYTLSGVKVATPTKGMYIHGGKKVFIK